jgi:hypothetical protein
MMEWLSKGNIEVKRADVGELIKSRGNLSLNSLTFPNIQ